MAIRQIARLCKLNWQMLWQRDEGANLVLIALIMPVLLGFAGLALDGSNAYYQQQRMQVAADAAALGGARLLAISNSTAQAQSEAQSLAALNGASSVPTPSFLNDNTEIQVTVERTFDTFFAGIMGYHSMTVSASARAQFYATARTSAGNLLPMGVPCSRMVGVTFGELTLLHDTGATTPGNVAWLRWSEAESPNAPKLALNIATPANSPVLHIGDLMYGTTGRKPSSDVNNALNSWIGKRVTVPLFEEPPTGSGSNAIYRICGFAEFILSSYGDQEVRGTFVRSVATGGPVAPGVIDFGDRAVRMTQ